MVRMDPYSCVSPETLDIREDKWESRSESETDTIARTVVGSYIYPPTCMSVESLSLCFCRYSDKLDLLYQFERSYERSDMSEILPHISYDDKFLCTTMSLDVLGVSTDESYRIPLVSRSAFGDEASSLESMSHLHVIVIETHTRL